jgi:hypothetical protein
MTIDKETGANLRYGTPALTAVRDKYTQHITLMEDEERKLHDAFCENILKDLAPDGALEIQIAYTVAQDTWRCARYSSVQHNLFRLGHEPVMNYVALLDRRLRENTAQLNRMQITRRAERDRQLDKAAALAQLNFSKGYAYNPNYDFSPDSGFTFSIHEIEARIDRNARLNEAKALARKAKKDYPKAA